MTQTHYRQWMTLAGTLVVLAALGVGFGRLATRYAPKADSQQNTSQIGQTIAYEGQNGQSVLDLLKRDHQVETIDSSFGVFVKSIDGITQTDNAFWIYYIDGQPGDVAVDKATTQAGQMITWRYETFKE